jgi:hypothetical protein
MNDSKLQKPVHKYDPQSGDYIESFDSAGKASEKTGIDRSHIGKAARGQRYTAGNYIWSFQKEENFHDTNAIDRFALAKGIDPSEITKTKIYQTVSGEDRISIETNRERIKSPKEIEIETFQKKQKLLQRKQDENRVLNKHFREYSRIENTLTALNEELVNLLTTQTFKPQTYEHPVTNSPVLVVQVTDLHFNELVELPDNQYGFIVGSKRMQKFARKIRKIAQIYEVSNIVVAITGDLLNSDRRLDEQMHMATNRMKASLIATEILYHFLQDINRVANLSIISVSGNESRVKDEFSMSEIMMSDNYDFLIFNMLKKLFLNAKGITFEDGDPVEQVINVNNSNILISHGTSIKEGQAAMQQVFGKYAAKGILLDYAIFGHIHFTNITDIYSRSGSLVGNNVYSDRSLNLVTKASQVVHVINTDGNIDNIKVGLQYINDVEGYDIKDDLKAYNSKMADNTKERTTIVKVII